MIQSQSYQYRYGSEPLHGIAKSLNLPIQFEYVQEICIFEQLIKLVQISEKLDNYSKYFTNSFNQLEQLKPFYQTISSSFNQGVDKKNEICEHCNHIQNFIIHNQFKYLEHDKLLSVSDMLLVELLEIVSNMYPNILYNNYQILYQYIARVLSNNVLQNYYFNVDFMMKDFSPNIKNVQNILKGIISTNLSTFHDFAQCQGILYRYKEDGKQFPDNCPVSLFPLYINYDIINDLKKKTILQQKVVAKMGMDFEWYTSILGRLAKHDEFIRRMISIQGKVEKSQTKCPYTICIVRNDFLHHASLNQWMQVEYNCIAISFGFISDRVQKYHSLLFDSYYKQIRENYKLQVKQDLNHDIMVDALHKAYELYNNKNAIVLIITAEFEGNVYDQRYIEKGLAKLGILSKRTTFLKLIGNITSENGILRAFGQEIALVYFRTGYTFDQYENEECWNIREMIELSKALKCPSLNTQLVNFKKLQQILLDETQIQKFLNKDEAKLISENYCKIWGFDHEDQHEKLIEMIKQNPHDYVLKPQREGGGNNYYDDQIIPELQKLTPEQRTEFIVMERIKPIPRIGFMMRRGQLDIQAVISEISVIGYFINDGEKILVNEVGGYLVRTKRYLDNEGGVAAGYAVVDSFMVSDS
ncbi:unnamed protein product [Paramecium pentaurelia]|uniref:glutathione synthase n=1 Tax=Paramecium pentaurelia TaxID=43138 RepID=A0A8S1Y0W4_9CILI|nr:unnamed protein product [Paramecium pentaurelia]